MLSSIWMIGQINEHRTQNLKLISVALLISLILLVVTSYSPIKGYFSEKLSLIIVSFFAILFAASTMYKLRHVFTITMILLIIISGIYVNPINRGTFSVYGTPLAKQIMKIKKQHLNSLRIGEGTAYNYLPMFGVKTFTPNMKTWNNKTWNSIDESGKYDDTYNRYAHVRVSIVPEPTSFDLNQGDVFTVNLSRRQIQKKIFIIF